jgi:hypothetical protein
MQDNKWKLGTSFLNVALMANFVIAHLSRRVVGGDACAQVGAQMQVIELQHTRRRALLPLEDFGQLFSVSDVDL